MPLIVLPSTSCAATMSVVVAAVPVANDVCPAEIAMEPAIPSATTEALNGVPETTGLVTEPVPRTFPVAFAPSYSVIANVSVPTGAAPIVIVQVRPLAVVVQFGEPFATFATTGVAMPLIATEIDAVEGERNFGCLRDVVVFAAAGNVSASVPLSKRSAGVVFVIAPPEHADSARAANNVQLLAMRRANDTRIILKGMNEPTRRSFRHAEETSIFAPKSDA